MRLGLPLLALVALLLACSSKSSQKIVPNGDGGSAGSGGSIGSEAGSDNSGSGGSARGGSNGNGGSSSKGGSGSGGASAGAGGQADAGAGDVEVCDGDDDDADGTDDFVITALRFTNQIDAVIVPDDPSLDFGPAGTLEAWALPEVVSVEAFVFNKYGNGEDLGLIVGAGGELVGQAFYGAGALNPMSPPGAVTSGAWTHVAFVWNASGSRLFVGGSPVAEQNMAAEPADGDGQAHIGSIARDGQQKWPIQGFIAEVRLSVVARYTGSFTPAPVLEADAVTSALWRLDEGSGFQVLDASDNGNDGVIQGPLWASAPCRPGMIEPQ